MNAREKKARQIMSVPNHAFETIGENTFKVRSQSDPSKFYIITRTGNGLVCECPDHRIRKADCKHIKVILEYVRRNVFGHEGFRIMERSKIRLCKFCDSGNVIKKGTRKNKNGDVQIFKCTDCNRRFTANFGFEKKQFDDRTVTAAL